MTDIDTLAATVRTGLDTDERLALAAQPGPWISGSSDGRLVDRVVYGQSVWPGNLEMTCTTYAGEYGLPNAAHIARNDPARVLARVARDRRMLELLLAEEHRSLPGMLGCAKARFAPSACDCGRDERVAALLAVLAESYAVTT